MQDVHVQLEKILRESIEISKRTGKSFDQLLDSLKRIEDEKQTPLKN